MATSISLQLLLVLVAVFVLQMFVPVITTTFYFDPGNALARPWEFVTSMFLHGNMMHLLLNGYALFAFGPILERAMNRKQYLIVFFGAGIFGSVLYYLTYLLGVIPDIPALGASGAIFGILGALAVLAPRMTVFIFMFPLPMKYAAVLWFFLELWGSFDVSSGVASAAHLGGLVVGILYAKYLVDRGEVGRFV
jgi:membrane associated rhomboid family serine protease